MPARSRLALFLAPVLKALLLLVLLVLAAAWPAHALAGAEGVLALGLAALVSLGGFVLGRVPHLFLTHGPDAIFHASMAGLGARLLGTLAIAMPILFFADLPRTPFAMGLVLSYFALLILEVIELVRAAQPVDPAVESERDVAHSGTDGAPK